MLKQEFGAAAASERLSQVTFVNETASQNATMTTTMPPSLPCILIVPAGSWLLRRCSVFSSKPGSKLRSFQGKGRFRILMHSCSSACHRTTTSTYCRRFLQCTRPHSATRSGFVATTSTSGVSATRAETNSSPTENSAFDAVSEQNSSEYNSTAVSTSTTSMGPLACDTA